MKIANLLRIMAVLVVCGAPATRVWADVGSLADSNGEIVGWGNAYYAQLNIPAGTFKAFATGGHHSLAIRTDGTLAGWGDNFAGQATVPTGTFADVAAGINHSLGVRTDGTLAVWGDNAHGQLNNLPTGTFSDAAAGVLHSVGLRTDGTLATWGDNTSGQLNNLPTGTFKAVAAGGYHNLGIRTDGTLAGWGDNWAGQSTVPTGTFADVAGGFLHSVGLRTDGTLAAWGENTLGQTNIPAEYTSFDFRFTDVAAGDFHNVALRTDGTLAGWGMGSDGFPLTAPWGKFVAVVAAKDYALALRARTSYDDLVVNGTGAVTDVASWFNRNITVAGNVTIQSTLYTVDDYATMTVGGGITLESGGQIQSGGFAKLEGEFVGQAGSSIIASGGVLRLGTNTSANGFVHNGTMAIGHNGEICLDDADTAVLGGHTMVDGWLRSGNGITLTSTGSIEGSGIVSGDLTNHGVVTGANGPLYLADGLVTGEGDVLGDVHFLRGTYAPGNSPASVTLDDPTFYRDTLLMELAGLEQGTEYDHLDILGTATLDRPRLTVKLIDGFTPLSGNYFDLFDGSLSGTFDTLNLPTLTTGLYWDWSTLYDDGFLRVLPAAVPAPGAAILVLLGTGMITAQRRRS